jgi:hypothetical protein
MAKNINVDEYQRIVEGAELDISLKDRDGPHRGDAIDEWKASYISN